MKYLLVEHVKNDQIILIKDELTNLFYVAVESVQNYSFSPDLISKPFKTKKAALNNFNKVLDQYKSR